MDEIKPIHIRNNCLDSDSSEIDKLFWPFLHYVEGNERNKNIHCSFELSSNQ